MFGYKRSLLTVGILTAVALVAVIAINAVSAFRSRGILINYTEDISSAQSDRESTSAEMNTDTGEGAHKEESIFPLNINIATAEELDTLPGIGTVKANAIIAYREEHGGFNSVEELINVKGIGEATVQKLRMYVCM